MKKNYLCIYIYIYIYIYDKNSKLINQKRKKEMK